MKKYLLLILTSVILLGSCQKDDLSWMQEIESIKAELANQKKLIEALQANANITGIETNGDSYTIKFSNGQSITLTNGKTPLVTIGDNGDWYINGEDTGCPSRGEDGNDGVTPAIEIVNGHWWINGKDTGIKAEGKDGADSPIIIQVIDNMKSILFIFSDGSMISCPKMAITFDDMYVSKDNSRIDVYVKTTDNKYILYPIIKRAKAFAPNAYPAHYDNWGLSQVEETTYDGEKFTHGSYLFRGGEAEMAMMVKHTEGKFQFIGGSYHGFETICQENGNRMIIFEVDGHRYSEDDIITITPTKKVVIIQKTTLFMPYTNDNPIAEVTKTWCIENGDLNITCNIVFIEDTSISNTYIGMMSVYRHIEGKEENGYLTRFAYRDNEPFKLYEITDGWDQIPLNYPLKSPDHDCHSMTEYGETSRTFTLSSISDQREKSGGFFVSTNAGTYNKMYFAHNLGESFYPKGSSINATTRISIK